ncbi:MAG: hypothetical protein LQ340_006347 [Diploschistes diacapsis]|nr:MAG: hypothetical protein LQ340_006347 [Diploschistes diacapsis]
MANSKIHQNPLVLLFTIPFLGLASGGNASQPIPSIHLARQDGGSSVCGISGNGDLYGLGIRFGFYLQMLATILAYHEGLEDDVANMVDVNSIFMTAIAIATFVVSGGSDQRASPAEIFLNLYIFFGTLVINLPAYTPNITTPGGYVYRFFIAGAMTAYGVWFWFIGIDSLQTGNCTSYIFLFARLQAQGSVLTFFKVISIGTLWFFVIPTLGFVIVAFILLVVATLTTARRMIWAARGRKRCSSAEMHYGLSKQFIATEDILGTDPYLMLEKTFFKAILQKISSRRLCVLVGKIKKQWRATKAILEEIPDSRRKPKTTPPTWKLMIPLSLVQFLVFVYIVLAVELTITWNNIADIYNISSTGQFIAFLTGAAGLWLVILRTYARHLVRRGSDRQWAVKEACFEGSCCAGSELEEQPEGSSEGPAKLEICFWSKAFEPYPIAPTWQFRLLT